MYLTESTSTDALSDGELFYLDMGSLTAANATALSWVNVEKPPFDTDNYSPVMAVAQNHVHFLDVPGVPAGSAIIFVIHCLYLIGVVLIESLITFAKTPIFSQILKRSQLSVGELSWLSMAKQHRSSLRMVSAVIYLSLTVSNCAHEFVGFPGSTGVCFHP
jgi:hypothetical protein